MFQWVAVANQLEARASEEHLMTGTLNSLADRHIDAIYALTEHLAARCPQQYDADLERCVRRLFAAFDAFRSSRPHAWMPLAWRRLSEYGSDRILAHFRIPWHCFDRQPLPPAAGWRAEGSRFERSSRLPRPFNTRRR